MQRKEKSEESPLMRDYRDDWRVMGQEGYLMDKHLVHRRFDRAICRDDFLQCEFCWRVLDDTMCYFEPDKRASMSSGPISTGPSRKPRMTRNKIMPVNAAPVGTRGLFWALRGVV